MKVIIADKGYQANDESKRAIARSQFFRKNERVKIYGILIICDCRLYKIRVYQPSFHYLILKSL